MRGILLLVSLLMGVVIAVPKSRFNRPIDERKLEKDYEDEESEDWHEDSYEWKRKMQEKKPSLFSMEDLTTGKMKGNIQEKVLQNEAQSGNMQMAFATIKSSVTTDPKEIEKIGGRWQALLATNSVQTKMYPVGGQDLLFTEDAGRILEVKDFVIAQPEAEKFRWKDTDFTPSPTPKPATKKGEKKATKGTDEL